MTPTLTLEVLEGDAPALYAAIAPFAMSRGVVKELGGPIYTTPNHRWIVACIDSNVAAFGGLELVGSERARFDWTYVVAEHRRQGLFGVIGERKLELCQGRRITTCTRTPWLLPWFYGHGFTNRSHRGEWRYLERP